MNIEHFIRNGAGFKYRTPGSNHIIPENTEIDIINLPPNSQPYTLLHQTALNNYVITVSFVTKKQDPTTKRESIQNHTFFLPLSSVMNDYVQKLTRYEGKEGMVNV